MEIDSLLIDLEIIGQIYKGDKLAIAITMGNTKLFVDQGRWFNGIKRKYNGYNKEDSIKYIENLVIKIENCSKNIISGTHADMAGSIKNSITNAINGLNNLKLTYTTASEIVAKLTISVNKLTKVFEELNEFNNTIEEGINNEELNTNLNTDALNNEN